MTTTTLNEEVATETKRTSHRRPKARSLIAATLYLVLVAIVSYVSTRLGLGMVVSSLASAVASIIGGHLKDGCPSH
jgi:hypothetical protein